MSLEGYSPQIPYSFLLLPPWLISLFPKKEGKPLGLGHSERQSKVPTLLQLRKRTQNLMLRKGRGLWGLTHSRVCVLSVRIWKVSDRLSHSDMDIAQKQLPDMNTELGNTASLRSVSTTQGYCAKYLSVYLSL